MQTYMAQRPDVPAHFVSYTAKRERVLKDRGPTAPRSNIQHILRELVRSDEKVWTRRAGWPIPVVYSCSRERGEVYFLSRA